MNEPKRGLLGTPRPIPTSEEEHQRQHEEAMEFVRAFGEHLALEQNEKWLTAFMDALDIDSSSIPGTPPDRS